METQLNCKEVYDALMSVKGIIELRTPLPILTHCMVESNSDNDTTTITVTNLEILARFVFQSETLESGSTCLPCRDFMDLLKGKKGCVSLSSNRVTEAIGCREVVIRTVDIQFDSGLKATLSAMDASDYPAWAEMASVNQVNGQQLVKMIDRVLFASSNDDSRFNLNGVCIERIDQPTAGECPRTRFIATDGHRLAMIDENIDLSLAVNSKVIVPKRGLIQLVKFIGKNKGNVSVGFGRKDMVIESKNGTMIIRLIEGDYPDYLQVVPTDSTAKEVLVDRKQLLDAINEFKPMMVDRYKGVNITLNGKIDISANHPDKGNMALSVECVSDKDIDVNLILNREYVAAALSNSKDSEMTISYYREGAPVKFSANDHWSIVMPMRK